MDQDIEIPSLFLCPISLQLMRDPVTVSTGITYDRDSIENWLFSCRSSICPVTKQILSDIITPNHTLRRLIQSWCIVNAGLGVERIPTPKPPVDESQIAKLIGQAASSDHGLKCLQRLKSIASHGERYKKCLESAGAVEYLASLLAGNASLSTAEMAVDVLFHLRSSEARLKSVVTSHGEVIMDALVAVLRGGSYQSRASSAVLLRSMLGLAEPVQLMTLKPELFVEVVSVLRDKVSPAASKAALKLLTEASPWGRNRVKAVEGGAVFVLVELLLEHSSGSPGDKRACELALTALDQLCGCAEGRAELLRHGAGLAAVSKKILRVSHAASDRAVRVLASVGRYSVTARVLQEMLHVGVVAKLCLVLQVESSLKMKERAKEILKLHSRVWKSSSCIPSHLLSSYPSSSS